MKARNKGNSRREASKPSKVKPRATAEPSMICAGLTGFEGLTEERIQARTLQMLFRSLNAGRLMAFVGSGVSRAYGYPSWDCLVGEIKKQALSCGAAENLKSEAFEYSEGREPKSA